MSMKKTTTAKKATTAKKPLPQQGMQMQHHGMFRGWIQIQTVGVGVVVLLSLVGGYQYFHYTCALPRFFELSDMNRTRTLHTHNLQTQLDQAHQNLQRVHQRINETQAAIRMAKKRMSAISADSATAAAVDNNVTTSSATFSNHTNHNQHNVVTITTTAKQQQHIIIEQRLLAHQRTVQTQLQAVARTLLLLQFGKEPYRVEIQLTFFHDPIKSSSTSTHNNITQSQYDQRMVIEMAPAAHMPYTVWWFLNQVTQGLHNHTSFYRNTNHVVIGGPVPNFMTPPHLRSELVHQFVDSGFHKVLFQEYSDAFPHALYRLGYAGRPGGPDFFVSISNQTYTTHGPGGQKSYGDADAADPCFARVLDEFHPVVDRIHQLPIVASPATPGGNTYKRLQRFVAIVGMAIL